MIRDREAITGASVRFSFSTQTSRSSLHLPIPEESFCSRHELRPMPVFVSYFCHKCCFPFALPFLSKLSNNNYNNMSNKVFISSRSFGDATQVPQQAPSAYQRSPRFNYWLVFFICSLIVVGSSIEAVSIWCLFTLMFFDFWLICSYHSRDHNHILLQQSLTECTIPNEASRIKNGPSAAPWCPFWSAS